MKIRNTLLIGLAVIHFSVTNLIIASSSTTTSSSDQPASRLKLVGSGVLILEPADPVLDDASMPPTFLAAREKFINAVRPQWEQRQRELAHNIVNPFQTVPLSTYEEVPPTDEALIGLYLSSRNEIDAINNKILECKTKTSMTELEAMLAQNEALLSRLQQHGTNFLSGLYLGSTPHEASFFNELYSRLGQAISGTLNRR